MDEATQHAHPTKSEGEQLPIKLVIWDLDDTYWHGTLSEGAIRLIPENVAAVRHLNARGIVNAICSKNTFEDVKNELVRANEWDQFVFPSVDWTPKGPRISAMLSDMGLRAANVLFVDDNVVNLREAEHYAPGIQTAMPHEFATILDSASLAGKDDSHLTRLDQYRILQEKASARADLNGSNEEFLAASAIEVDLRSDTANHTERLLELVNRSNQLNYTKQRFTPEEFAEMIADPNVSSGYVTVRDNFGDHGICGFFAHDSNEIINFSFSCRILNMGVENWVYQQLGALGIKVVGDVATPLDATTPVTWISAAAMGETHTGSQNGPRPSHSGRVLLKGGCDLSVLVDHLGGDIETEFSFPSSTGALVHQEHTEILKRASPRTLEDYGEVIDKLPFLDRGAYKSVILDEPERFTTVVYSALMDFTQGLYRYRDSDFVIPFGEFTIDATDPANQDLYVERLSGVGYTSEFFEWFSDNFSFEGVVSPEKVGENLSWLRAQLPDDVQLIIINGAEVKSPSEAESDRHEHHARCNRAIDTLVASNPLIELCDVRSVITSSADLTNNLRHYSRRSYFDLANSLAKAIRSSEVRSASSAQFAMKEIARWINRVARRVVLRVVNFARHHLRVQR